MVKIFINYLRDDDPGHARALYQQLGRQFSDDELFMDVEGDIEPGDRYVGKLREAVKAADVLIVVIGRDWHALMTPGHQRAHKCAIMEIWLALQFDKRVIPTLVGGARMPRRSDLPAEIGNLSEYSAIALRPDRFDADCAGLVKCLRKQFGGARAEDRDVFAAARRLIGSRRIDEAEFALRRREAEEMARDNALRGISDEEIRLHEECVNWQFVERFGDVGDLRDHLARFQGGPTQRCALARLEELEWEQLGPEPEPDDLLCFVSEFSSGPYAQKARHRLEQQRRQSAEQERLRRLKVRLDLVELRMQLAQKDGEGACRPSK